MSAELVHLGSKLFHEKKFSSDETVACVSCHDITKGGDGGVAHSKGVGGQLGAVNAPTVFNASLNYMQFWDGRAATLEEQVGGPIENPLELGSLWAHVVEKLKSDAAYTASFAALFPDRDHASNIASAIAAFETTLITERSPIHRFLRGDERALTPEQRSGYELFKNVGCVACHQGRNVGGNMVQRFGVLGDYFKDRGNITEADYGRYNLTHIEADRFVFRVPSLRNVERTAPYFHDGWAPTLEQTVQIMAKYQLGRTLSDDQIAAIVAFLSSLSGEIPKTATEKGG